MIRSRFLPISTLFLILICSTGWQDAGSRNETWTVSLEPVLQIGEKDGADEYLFVRVPFSHLSGSRGTFRLSDGRIVVGDRIDRTIRVFDPSGRFLFRFGGDGGGPGESKNTLLSCVPNGSEIVAWENNRVSFFDSEGESLVRANLSVPYFLRIHGVFPDRSILVRNYDPTVELDRSRGVHTLTGGLKIQGADGQVSSWTLTINSMTIGTLKIEGESGRSILPFGPSSLIRVAGDEFVYGWSESYEISVYGRDGKLKRTFRRDWEPVPLTRADREGHLPFDSALPDHYPVFDQSVVDRLGFLWVRRGEPPHRWDVFDLESGWVTTVTLPTGVDIHDIGEDYILGVWKGEEDVEYVRQYSLERKN